MYLGMAIGMVIVAILLFIFQSLDRFKGEQLDYGRLLCLIVTFVGGLGALGYIIETIYSWIQKS